MTTDGFAEKARELGRLLGQSPEYQALDRARTRAMDDRDLNTSLNRMAELERDISTTLRGGQEPPQATQDEYELVFSTLQSSAIYQGLVAAQANFDKILGRVNEHISEGIESGSRSRIILPT
jgi:cell fate (sporulation/competence/biofilm development) regulator YlbF (YheA/YmcA/DUF963 family)